jgi:hypothetical protein
MRRGWKEGELTVTLTSPEDEELQKAFEVTLLAPLINSPSGPKILLNTSAKTALTCPCDSLHFQ